MQRMRKKQLITKPVNSWTCEDFRLWTNPSSQLQLVLLEALNNKDKPEDAVLDVQGYCNP